MIADRNRWRAALAAELARLSEVYDRPISEVLAADYAQALDGFDASEIHDAVSTAIRTSRWRPRPAELVETMRDQRVARRRALAEAERARALPPAELSEVDRQDILSQIRGFTARLVGVMHVRPRPRRSLAEMEREVAQLRATDRADTKVNVRKSAELERMRAAGLLISDTGTQPSAGIGDS
jgi:hypothetical protein